MINFDRHQRPSPSSSNLILPVSSHSPWQSDNPAVLHLHPDHHHHHFDTDPNPKPRPAPTPTPDPPLLRRSSRGHGGPVTPVDAHDPVLSRISETPSPPSPGDAHSGSPGGDTDPTSSPPPDPTPDPTSSDPPPTDQPSSRHSTPLSDLSSSPDKDPAEPAEAKPVVAEHHKDDHDQGPEATNPSSAETAAQTASPPVASRIDSSENTSPPPTEPTTTVTEPDSLNPPPPEIPAEPLMGEVKSPNLPLPAPTEDKRQDPPIQSPPNDTQPRHASSAGDPRVVAILDLNAELLKVYMDFQARGIHPGDSKFVEYSTRLQSNLQWLAASVDKARTITPTVTVLIPLPNTEPPPPVDFAPMDRINQLYSQLPILFAKDIMRRQLPSAPTNLTLPADQLNANLKRLRPEDLFPGMSNKRRDTGESKIMSRPGTAQGTISGSPGPDGSSPAGTFLTPQRMSTPQLGSPSMPPLTSEIQPSAHRERMRQVQMQQQTMSLSGGGPRMSPPSGVAVASRQQLPPGSAPNTTHSPAAQGGSGSNSMSGANQMSAMGALGPAAMQNYQILQNPNHPLTQYLVQSIPGFMAMPVQQQLQRMFMMQAAMQAKTREQQQQILASRGGSMPANSASAMPNVIGAPGQYPMQTSSPPGTSSPQQVFSSQPASTMFPGNPAMNPGMVPNIGAQSPPGMANLVGMHPQSRQLYLMQQQQQMMQQGGGNQMFVAPDKMRQDQQRLQQAHRQASPHNIPSPASVAGSGDGFPGLRPGSAVPGIARSTRSPSESGTSPMTPRIGSRVGSMQPNEEYHRMLMQQQAQRGLVAQGSNPGYPGQQQQPQMGTGQSGAGWQSNPQQQQQQGQMGHASYSMSPPGSAGPGLSFPNSGGAPSPTSHQNWSAQGMGAYPHASPSPAASQHHSEHAVTPGRGMSLTPAPPQQHGSPTSGHSDFQDMFNWEQ